MEAIERTCNKLNHTGFFVEMDECVSCGCCIGEAPNNFSYFEDSNAFDPFTVEDSSYAGCTHVHKQPETHEELTAVVSAMRDCITGAIYYGGNDAEILDRLIDQGVQPFATVQNEKSKLRQWWIRLWK